MKNDNVIRIKLTLSQEHRINFGTADKPELKADGDEHVCDKKNADALVNVGLAIYADNTKEENVDGQ